MVKNSELTKLLLEFSYLFEEPRTLPPQRVHDHRIPLIEGSKPVNIRPYKHSSLHKTVIEYMIQELLQKGIIQPSVSPFSSPIVLVKKKENSWRMCIDYRELYNKGQISTSKDR